MAGLISYQRRADSTSRYDKRLAQILRIAARLMARQGYEKTSVRQVAKQAKVTLSGLYYYMTGKEELLFLIQFHTFDSLVRTLRGQLAACDSPESGLRAVISTHLNHFLIHMDELKVCARELETLSGKLYRKVLALRREYFAMTLSVVRELAERNGSRLDPEIATLSLFGALNWMYQWYGAKRKVAPDRLETELTQLFLSALGSGGGNGAVAGGKETRG
jgi:AcrR family transcriptional regulator